MYSLKRRGQFFLNFYIIKASYSSIYRTTMFAYLGVATYVGQMIGSPITSAAMEVDPWLSIFLGVGAIALCGVVVLILPETLNLRPSSDLPPDLVTESGDSHAEVNWMHAFKKSVLALGRAEMWYIWRKKAVALLLFTFILTTLGKFLQELILQYATNRYHWTWARVSLLRHFCARFHPD
jgi:MFS family permease